jgi:hypothetical protein
MADGRMPTDTAQKMIDDAKRKAQGQEDLMGFRVPEGMDDDARKAWEAAIREREVLFRRDPPVDEFGNEIIGAPRNPTALQRKTQRYAEQVIGPTFEDLKQTATELPGKIGRGAKAVGEAVIDAATVVPRTKAAIAADPEGAKQFASNVMSGDREAIRSMATEASGGIVEPLATMGDAVLGGMAAQEGKPLEAAGYAGLILVPGVAQTLGKSMSKGWLKSAAEAGEKIPGGAAKKLDDLAKRVDAGEITDDMQVRREIARVEDAYRLEYMQSVPPVGERKSAFEPFPEYVPSPTGITSDSTKRKIADDVSKVTETSERIKSKLPGGGGRSVDERLGAEGIPVRMPAGSGIPMTADALMRKAINDFDMFNYGDFDANKLYRVRQPNYPEGFAYVEASSPEALEELLRKNGELFEEFLDGGGIIDATQGGRRGGISDFISEASPEESAKYFDMKGGGEPLGGGGAKGLREFNLQDRPGLDLDRSPKFGVPDAGGDLVIRDLGPLTEQDRYVLRFQQKKYNLSDAELKEYRDELGSRGYDDIVGQARDLPPDRMPQYGTLGGRTLETLKEDMRRMAQDEKALAAKPVKQKYTLYDPRTDEPFKTRGGKIKQFSSPEAADEYATETLNDFTLKILDLDGKPAPGY